MGGYLKDFRLESCEHFYVETLITPVLAELQTYEISGNDYISVIITAENP